jgi:hypothetical protein
MGSSSKRRQTMAKMNRERAVKERRARKQEKKDERKRAAAEQEAEATSGMVPAPTAENESGDEQAAAPPS